MAPIGCPKKSVRNYHSTLRKFPKIADPNIYERLIRHVHSEGSGTVGESVVEGCTCIADVWLKVVYLKGLRHCSRWRVALQSEETAKFPHFVLSTHDVRLFVPGAKCKVDLQLSYRPVGTKPFTSHLCTPPYRFTTANLLYEVRVYFWSDFPIM